MSVNVSIPTQSYFVSEYFFNETSPRPFLKTRKVMVMTAIVIPAIRAITTAATPPIIVSEICGGSSSLLLSTASMSVEVAVGVRDPNAMEVILFHATLLMV